LAAVPDADHREIGARTALPLLLGGGHGEQQRETTPITLLIDQLIVLAFDNGKDERSPEENERL
jgi:hypothetical protein